MSAAAHSDVAFWIVVRISIGVCVAESAATRSDAACIASRSLTYTRSQTQQFVWWLDFLSGFIRLWMQPRAQISSQRASVCLVGSAYKSYDMQYRLCITHLLTEQDCCATRPNPLTDSTQRMAHRTLGSTSVYYQTKLLRTCQQSVKRI